MTSPEFQQYMLDLSSGKYGVDESKRIQDDPSVKMSFRKLNLE